MIKIIFGMLITVVVAIFIKSKFFKREEAKTQAAISDAEAKITKVEDTVTAVENDIKKI